MTSSTAQSNEPDFEIAYQAFCDGDVTLLEKLSSGCDFPKGVDGFVGRHWLSNAIAACNLASLTWVLGKDVEVNFEDDEGSSAITWALQMENDYGLLRPGEPDQAAGTTYTIAVLDLLNDAGADVNMRLTLDETALHVAARWSSPSVIRHLLDLGADPTVFDAEYTPRQPVYYAKFGERWEAAAVLEAAMTSRSG